jgi:hypothetical protein
MSVDVAESVKNAAADGIRSIFAACPNLDCMLPSGNAANDFVELSKSLMCISKVDLAAPGVSEACTQLLGPIKAMQAQQQQVHHYTLIALLFFAFTAYISLFRPCEQSRTRVALTGWEHVHAHH